MKFAVFIVASLLGIFFLSLAFLALGVLIGVSSFAISNPVLLIQVSGSAAVASFVVAFVSFVTLKRIP